jgi:hypothetical protein
MQRSVWITALVAALFGLQGPLCAVACGGSAAAEVASHASPGAMPCHEAPESSNPEPAQPEQACDCGDSAVRLNESVTAIPALVAGVLPARSVAFRGFAPVSIRVQPRAPERLPPPASVLLNPTLII